MNRQAVIDMFEVKSKVQTEWRWLILVAFFLGGVGGGLFLAALFTDFVPGMLAGLLIVVVGKSTAHILFLGRPERFWRMFASPQTSWISRGLFIVASFSIFGVLYVAPLITPQGLLPWAPDTTVGWVLRGLSITSAVLLMTYTGFVMAYSPAIQFWSTPLLPALFGLYSLSAGIAGLFVTLFVFGERGVDTEALATIEITLIVSAMVFVGMYISTMWYGTIGAREAVHLLMRGELAMVFWGGVVLVGLIIPLAMVVYSHFSGLGVSPTVVGAAFLEMVGGFLLRYSLLRAGVFTPVV